MKNQARNVFDELNEGFDALQGSREGKLTLRTVRLEEKPAPTITAGEVVEAREKLRVSRGVFARWLRTNPRTLENWEQGRAKPNAQAALLIRMVAKNPEIVRYLEEV
ncbi:MAG: helix-turn-helix domain-containing protein [Ramlibacter sp.]